MVSRQNDFVEHQMMMMIHNNKGSYFELIISFVIFVYSMSVLDWNSGFFCFFSFGFGSTEIRFILNTKKNKMNILTFIQFEYSHTRNIREYLLFHSEEPICVRWARTYHYLIFFRFTHFLNAYLTHLISFHVTMVFNYGPHNAFVCSIPCVYVCVCDGITQFDVLFFLSFFLLYTCVPLYCF